MVTKCRKAEREGAKWKNEPEAREGGLGKRQLGQAHGPGERFLHALTAMGNLFTGH